MRWEFPELATAGGRTPWARVDFCAGGDKANIGAMHCISGCNGPCPCHLCERPREGMCETNPELLKADQKRDMERIELLAHTRLGVCPGCKMKIVEKVADPRTEMALAKADDEPPAKATWKRNLLKGQTDSWLKIHKGVVYGRHILLQLEPWRWVPCLLHMSLRIVGGMFSALVIDKIQATPEKGVDQKTVLMAQCKKGGVYIKEKKFDKKKNTVEAMQGPKISFGGAGADAEKIMYLMPSFLGTVHPASVRAKHPAVQKQYEKSLAVANQWMLLWQLFNTDLEVNQAAREERATKVDAAGREFVRLWTVAHKRTQGLYLHDLAAHMGDFIREFGDLRPFQAQGLEHAHSKRKMVCLTVTNRRPGERTPQNMSHLIAYEHTKREFRHTLDSREHEAQKRAKSQRAVRHAKKVSDLHLDFGMEPVTQSEGKHSEN